MLHHAKRIALQILGWLFVVLGLVGLVLPVLQGILFLIIGLYLLSREYQWAQRWMERLRARYPEVFRRARSWQALLGLGGAAEPGDPQPLSTQRRIAIWISLAILLLVVTLAGRAETRSLMRYWGKLQQRYEVVDVRQQDSAQVVELRRTWALSHRHYVVQCHICEPVQVGSSYSFLPMPGENPPMMKRLAAPGEIPDFYTVVEGEVPR